MANTKTLKHIMGSVRAAQNVQEAHRRAILSALSTAARVIGRSPGDIVASPAALQKELSSANNLQASVSKKRWTNVRSLTLEALRLAGSNVAPSRHTQVHYPEDWNTLRKAIPAPYMRIGLSRFMSFCVREGISKTDVDSTVFERFQTELLEGSIVRNPSVIFARTARLWDKAGGLVEGWPPHRTGMVPAPKGYSPPWDQYPASLTADVEAFLNRTANQDIFAEDYAPSIKAATVLGRRKTLRQMAAALVQAGAAPEDVTRLKLFVQPDNAKIILRHFIARRGGKANDAIYSHACLLRTIARTWVKNVPDYAALDILRRNVKHELKRVGNRRGMKQRNIKRLRQFQEARNIEALLGLPYKLMRRASELDTGTADGATIALYGAAIEILLVSAIRIKNLTHLKIGENLIVPADLKSNAVISVAGEDVKNGNPIEMVLPSSSTTLLRKYLKQFRPNLSDEASLWLFPNRAGRCRNVVGFSAGISDVIYRETGLEMHAHLFRHFALMLLERERPGAVEIGRRFLGHYNIQTTLNSYAENRTDQAHRLFEDVIEANRAHLGCDVGGPA